jgi:two-component system, chemotaxis family, chemotaxis protein CheY
MRATHPDASPAAHDRPRVMLADDDKGFREMLRDLLSDEGFQVVGEAADGAEAVEMAPKVSPDVVFMDLRMPEVDGIEATRMVKSVLPYAQVIILSAYGDPGLQRGAEQAGVYCYLIKGCPPQMIREVLSFAWNYKQGLERGDGSPDDPVQAG